jgi:ribulose-phosphate 3-epimerase
MNDHAESGQRAVQFAPSILAADFARLGEQVAQAERAGASRIHVDIMDGHFVPNLSMGAPIVKSLRKVTRLPLETHLMISDPDFFLDEFAEAGSDSFIVHWEGNNNLHRTIQRVKSLGKGAGLAINPATPASVLEEVLPDLDLVLVMTVNPGFGHQHFIHSTLAKILRTGVGRRHRRRYGPAGGGGRSLRAGGGNFHLWRPGGGGCRHEKTADGNGEHLTIEMSQSWEVGTPRCGVRSAQRADPTFAFLNRRKGNLCA